MSKTWVSGILAIATLAACQAAPVTSKSPKAPASSSPVQAPVAAPATNAPAQANPSASPGGPSAAPSATAPASSPTAFSIPNQVNIAIPSALLGSEFSALLGSEVTQLLGNDGGGLLGNDGGGLLGNDGGGLLSNDGGGIVASGGGNIVAGGAGNYRLSQATDSGIEASFALSASDLPQEGVRSLLMLYSIQAATLNLTLQKLRSTPPARWKPGTAVPILAQLVLPKVPTYLNVVSGRGPLGSGPIFWIFEVGKEAKGSRQAKPHMALHLQGPGQGRMMWVPTLKDNQSKVAFCTQFDLPKRRVVAELNAFSGPKGPQRSVRRVRWVFQGAEDGSTTLRAAALIRGAGAPDRATFRRAVLRFAPDGSARFAVRHGGPLGLMRWVDAKGEVSTQASWMELPGVAPLALAQDPSEAELSGPLQLEGMPAFDQADPAEPSDDAEAGLVGGWPSTDFPATAPAVADPSWADASASS